jgi:Rad3-related DNA helicase
MTAWETAATRAEQAGGGKFVRLKNDGDKIVGIFAGEPHVRETWFNNATNKMEHFTEAHKAAGKTASPRFLCNIFDLSDLRMKIIECNSQTFKDVLKVKEKYGLDKFAFEIERKGAKGDTKTTYTVLPDVALDKLTAEQSAAFKGAEKHDLTKENDEDDASTDMNSIDKKNGAAAAAVDATISADDAGKLVARLKPLAKDKIDSFLAKFGVQKVKELPARRLAEAQAFVESLEPKAPAAPPVEVDPFALPAPIMAGEDIPSPDRYLDATFGSDGYLARAFDGYQPRAGQVAFAHAVDRSIVEKQHLLAEAGTGTGKSVGYSVPATYHAHLTGTPVVIVTANIALQEQIARKDLPMLQKILPWPFTFQLLKGRNNYLCVDRFLKEEAEKVRRQGSFEWGGGRRETPEQVKQREVVTEWARASLEGGPGHEAGDMSELPFEPDSLVWRDFSVGSDACKGRRCKQAKDCFSQHARASARDANVIVTNYHMLFAHLAAYMDTGLDLILPSFEIVICDEVHKAPDIARDFFGFRFTEGSVKSLAKKVDEEPVADALMRSSSLFFAAMSGLRRDRTRYKARLTLANLGDHERSAWAEMSPALDASVEVFNRRCASLQADVDDAEADGDERTIDEANDALADAENVRDRARLMVKGLTIAMGDAEPNGVVCYLDEDARGQVSVCSRLVRASTALRPALFAKLTAPREGERGEAGLPVTVIGTSATIATDGNRFDYATIELGVDDPATMIADSPFDWPNQALFIVPEGLPEPNDKAFPDAVAATVETLIRMSGGSLLGLFTSRRILSHTYDSIFASCREQKISLFKQGDAPRTTLVQKFRDDPSSVLLGNDSFWAGVDVPGDALRVVVIDRLPFPTPDDPVLDALSQQSDKAFFTYSVPRAIIAFKQGFGRLVRATGDRGVVVCCDKRILTKRYGKQFLRALPDVPKSTRLEAAKDWLFPPPAPAWDEP